MNRMSDDVSFKYYYTRDHLGSVRDVTTATGALLARFDYDPFGRRVQVAGAPVGTGIGSFANAQTAIDFGYTGHYTNPMLNLVLAPYRAYDPELGRWISRDPIEEAGGLNLYGYVGNSVVNFIDELGLSKCSGILGQMNNKKAAIESKEKKIANLLKKIQERLGELRENPRNLPERHQPGMRNSESREKHRQMINEDKAAVGRHEHAIKDLKAEIALLTAKYIACLAAETTCKVIKKYSIVLFFIQPVWDEGMMSPEEYCRQNPGRCA